MINLFENFRSVVHEGKVKPEMDVDVNSNTTEVPSSNNVDSTSLALIKGPGALAARLITESNPDARPVDDDTPKKEHSMRAKKVVELSVEIAAEATTESSTMAPSKAIASVTVKKESLERGEKNEEEEDADANKVRGGGDKEPETDSSATTASLPSSKSRTTNISDDGDDRRRKRNRQVSSSSPTSCNTCDDSEAPVHCDVCRHAFCKRCSVTPSPVGEPWSCFLCQLDATRKPSTTMIEGGGGRRLRSGVVGRGGSAVETPVKPAAKRRRTRRPSRADSASSLSSFVGKEEASSLSSASSPTSGLVAFMDSTDGSSQASDSVVKDEPFDEELECSVVKCEPFTKKLECSAMITGNKTIEIKFKPCRKVVYGGGGGGGDRSSSPFLDSSLDPDMMDVEDPVIVDNEGATNEADEEEQTEDDEEQSDVDESQFEMVEEDTSATLKDKLAMALGEIRKLKAGAAGKRAEIKRVRRRLAWYHARLRTAQKDLFNVVAGSKGRTITSSPRLPPWPPKPAPNLVPWTDAEVKALRDAVAEYGPGHWKDMYAGHKDNFHPLRTRFNLRDRYKQLKAKKLW